jgi:hypothetical protein
MRLLKVAPELLMWLLIVGVALVNVAVYTGVVRGEDAIDLRTPSPADQPARDPAPSAQAPAAAALAALEAERDGSTALPGAFVSTQGRLHTGAYPLETRVPFCPEGEVADNCYASNPPTSGLHLPVQGMVLLPDGNALKVPPDPGIYAFEAPREAIPHIQEHAGVYIGYNCVSAACDAAVGRLTEVVTQRLANGARVVMSPDGDLAEDTIGLATWTRVDVFPALDFTEERAGLFIDAHSCRFDPEAFCQP